MQPGTTLWQPITMASVAPDAFVFIRNAQPLDFRPQAQLPSARPLQMGTVSSVDPSNARVVLFYDYRTNVEAYPTWQAWMRDKQPRLLVVWGKHDPSFDISEPEAYRRDVPTAEVHILDAGHFALDTAADQVAQHVRGFMK
jgi:pimeloyl-ACP methyl ester carboxylesterase